MRKPIATLLVTIERIMKPRVAPAAPMPGGPAFLSVYRPMLRYLLAVAFVLSVPVQSRAEIITPAGLVPGDQFRIVFVSDSRIQALSPDIATYDALIQGDATAAGLNTYNGQAVNWMVLGSTAAVSAVSRVPLSSNAPIYRIDGVLVASNATDLWDGSINAPINLTASGVTPFNNPANTYTGSNADGTAGAPFGGGDFVSYGSWPQTGSLWFQWGQIYAPNAAYTYYGISEVLTVPDTATDTDGDGVVDDEDECPDSDLSGTVVIDGHNSGVANTLFASGCTISDLIAECAEGARKHRKFVNCVSNLTHRLKKDGIITRKQKSAILRSARRADIP